MDTMYCHEHGDITTHANECPLCLVANLKAQVARMSRLLTAALPHIECNNIDQSGLITEIGEYLQQAKEKEVE